MAKCMACGMKKLFLKVDSSGLCAECAAIEKRKKEIEAIEQKAKAADSLLNEAIAKAETQAHKNLIEEEKRLNESISVLIPRCRATIHLGH